jgi:peptidoglycan/xylan/chitin deacetylase (PgdA/CDA1 family)
MRATFFIPTSYINERRLYWWERIAYVLSQARKPKATLTYPRHVEVDRKNPHAQNDLTSLIKDTPGLDVEKFVDGLCEAFGVEWNRDIEARYADDVVMTWDQLRALSRAGMDVESHTRRHRVLQTLDDDALRDELLGSRQDLEQQLGRPVRALAYPVGRRISRIAKIRNAIAAAGYRIGLSNASGATRIWPNPLSSMLRADPFDMRRFATDREMSDAMYFTQVAVPSLAYIGKHNRD